MVRIQFAIDLHYELNFPGADFVFNIHAAPTASQRIVSESLFVSQAVPTTIQADPLTHARYLRLTAPAGPLHVSYQALVDIDHHIGNPDLIQETPVAQLPLSVLGYIYPSRYCQSDRLGALSMSEFGHLTKGYRRVEAIRNWVNKHVAFRSNTSSSTTSALDTVTDRVGVCRDFAHLMIALCRAVNIPARFAATIDYGANPSLGPTDFHACVEVYLGDRWYLFDPSGVAIPMGFVRLGTGRDAADTAFSTIFGGVRGAAPVIQIEAIPNAAGQLVVPQHVAQALSTDGQSLPA
jgi:transglutaminase-like putative cysteine protease